MKKFWFSSDWHLGHKNILRYDQRPFETIEEHDEAIVNNYNELVHERDDFYFLGDFCLDYRVAEQHLSKLKGHLFFVKGNHDTSKMVQLYEKYGTYLGGLADLKIDNQQIVLCHYRMDVWNGSHRGSWNLHGHSHHTLKPSGKPTLDLGVNGWDYKPVEFNEIKELLKDINYEVTHRAR